MRSLNIKDGWQVNKQKMALLLSNKTSCRWTLATAIKRVVENTATVADFRILQPYRLHAMDIFDKLDLTSVENRADFELMSCSLSYEKAL